MLKYVFSSNWKNGYPDGIGKYTWKNGNWFNGNWKKGIYEGVGILHIVHGEINDSATEIKGFWKKGKYMGDV